MLAKYEINFEYFPPASEYTCDKSHAAIKVTAASYMNAYSKALKVEELGREAGLVVTKITKIEEL